MRTVAGPSQSRPARWSGTITMALFVGDKVRLKSGGPPMTVENIVAGEVHCCWFEGNELKRAKFPYGAIEKETAKAG